MDVRVVDDERGAAAVAAELIARRLRAAVRRRGRASLAISGGSSPVPMFDALASTPLPWHAITLLQVDERVAPDGHADRNRTLQERHLVEPSGIPKRNVRWMAAASASPERAASAYGRIVADLGPIDVVHLGVGDDGHTASWPPGDPVVAAQRPVAAIGEFNGRRRLTLTPGPVNAAAARVLHVVGASKADVLARYLARDRSLPITAVRRTGTIVVADRAAAARLTGAR